MDGEKCFQKEKRFESGFKKGEVLVRMGEEGRNRESSEISLFYFSFLFLVWFCFGEKMGGDSGWTGEMLLGGADPTAYNLWRECHTDC